MHHIKAHVAGAGDAEKGVHVGSIHVEQAAVVVHHFSHLLNILFKEADGIGVGQHQRCHITIKLALQILQIGAPVGIALDGDNLIARQRG